MVYIGELLKGSTDSLLLALIKEKPMYGYQLIKELERRSKGYFKFKEGTIYPALHRLEEDRLIVGTWEKLSNGQERRYYRLTRKGEEALSSRMNIWQEFAKAVNLVVEPPQNRKRV